MKSWQKNLLVLVVLVAAALLVRHLIGKLKSDVRTETDAKLDTLRNDLSETLKALQAENKESFRAIAAAIEEPISLPMPKPGLAGFGQCQPEPIV
jgi:hypothetical protein